MRRSDIDEVLLGEDRLIFDPREKQIRVHERRWSLELGEAQDPPPDPLFTAVRRKAHPVVVEKGLKSAGGKYVVLSPQKEMALRIGKRRDQNPVLLEIRVGQARQKGVSFHPFGELFLATDISPEFISGPPVSEKARQPKKDKAEREKEHKRSMDPLAGSFILGPNKKTTGSPKKGKGKKPKGWKERARKERKGKRQ